MAYQHPIAKVVDVNITKDAVTIELFVNKLLSPPLYPAGLYLPDNPKHEVLVLHRLMKEEGLKLTYESYGEFLELPINGESYIFSKWWSAEELKLVQNTALFWTREAYPDDGTHTHCPLTHEMISAYSGYKEGYKAGTTWITIKAYEQFIQADILRVRHPNDEPL